MEYIIRVYVPDQYDLMAVGMGEAEQLLQGEHPIEGGIPFSIIEIEEA